MFLLEHYYSVSQANFYRTHFFYTRYWETEDSFLFILET